VLVHPQTLASFTIDKDSQCLKGNVFKMTNRSTVTTTSIKKSKYDFGDLNSDNGSGLHNTTHRYSNAGKYIVKLSTETTQGCKDTALLIVVVIANPKPSILAQKLNLCFGIDSFRLKQGNSGSIGSQFLWSVSGLSSKSGERCDFTVDKHGEYTVKLLETSAFGCVDSVQQLLKSWPNPSARFGITKIDTCTSGNKFQFFPDSISLNGVKQYQWLYSDNTSSSIEKPEKHFQSDGKFTIQLNVLDSNGCKSSASKLVEVYKLPKANFDINSTTQCLKTNQFMFTSASSAGIGSVDSGWYYIGASLNPVTGLNAKLNFSTVGQKSVKLKVMNSKGCIDSLTKSVFVLSDPLMSFSVNQAQQCINNQQFEFTNRTLVPGSTLPIAYLWNFGDSTTNTQVNPRKQYLGHGSKRVLLKATASSGCWDTISQGIVVQAKPKAEFEIDSDTQCVSTNQFKFNNNSTLVSGNWTIKNNLWEFGDGGFGSSSTNASKKYSNYGSYSVRLIVITAFGCSDTAIKLVRVHPIPKVSYAVNNANQCLNGNNFQFTNSSTIVSGGGNLSYVWDFGNGTKTSNTNPSMAYVNANTYAVKLIAQTQYGCVDSFTSMMKAVSNPKVDFTLNSTNQCLTTNEYKFNNNTNAVNGGSLIYTWNMGDIGNSTSGLNTIYNTTNVTHRYAAAENYMVKLIAVNSIGCMDSISKQVSVKPLPTPAFDVNQANQCQIDNEFKFTNRSTMSFGAGTATAAWFFDDSTSSNTQNATRTFYQVRSYWCKLVMTSSFGCKDSLTKTVWVRPMPKASFLTNAISQCLNENKFVFTNSANITNGNLKYQWRFGDGSGSTVESPLKVFANHGIYTVTLKAISDFQCVDSVNQSVTLFSKPKADFEISDTGLCLNKNQFSFTNNSKNPDSSGMISRWDFGDKTNSALKSPTKSYSSEGDYSIRLAVTSSYGCKDSTSRSIRVYPQPTPSYIINNPGQCLTNNEFKTINYSSIGTNGGRITYHWTFGDGRTSDSTNPKWSYSSDDTFAVKLVVASSFGCVDSVSSNVVVYPQPLVAFSVLSDTQCFEGNKFEFKNNSTISSGIINYIWNFGNGMVSSNPSPVISYDDFGNYNVALFVRSIFGCRDSLTKSIRINPSPVANFFVNAELQCELGNDFQLTNMSSVDEGTLGHLWTLGDGNQAKLLNIRHSYTQFGEYQVRLKVTTNKGCSDTHQLKLIVKPNPRANFSVNDSSQCAKRNDFIFVNQSKIVQGKFNSQWNLGDKNSLLGLNARHTYMQNGVYKVQLKVSSAWGCTDTMSRLVYIRNQPIVDYSFDKLGACERDNVFTSNNISRVNDDTLYHRWDMGDGSQYNTRNIIHSYARTGEYKVRLIVFSNYGCVDSQEAFISVFPQGKSLVEIYDTAICFRNNRVTMGNFSRVNKDLFLFQSWDYGDGKIDTTLSVVPKTHSYSDTGSYKITLITTTQNFCRDTSYDEIKIKPMPEIDILSAGASYCLNNQKFEFYSNVQPSIGKLNNVWSFGDGYYSTVDTVQHLYRLPGSYKVQLVSTTLYGCSDTAYKSVKVNPLPIAAFTLNDVEQCQDNVSLLGGVVSNQFKFIDISQQRDANSLRFWKLGDGDFSNNDTVKHVYKSSGAFNVQLVILNTNGCSDTADKIVVIHPTPTSNIMVDSECIGTENQFYSNAGVSSGTLTSLSWNFGDGSLAGDLNPQHKYTEPGSYKVTLRVVSDQGCYLETKTEASVYENPIAKIVQPLRLVNKALNDSAYEEGFATINNPEYLFSDEQQIFDNSYEWNFGDGSDPSYEMKPSHRYSDTGSFAVSLLVTNPNGCMASDQIETKILPDHLILLPSAFSPNGDSHNDTYKALGRFHSIQKYRMTVNDANGILVFSTDDVLQFWNGKFNNTGYELSPGMYEVNIVMIDVYQQKYKYSKRVTLVR
jgi:PKD repeat protein